jgi:NO-binding membrane sensor protein with MHYT domain
MLIETQLSGFNPFLVLLSYVIAVFGSYTALAFARESLKVSARERLVWIIWAAVILGSVGVWSMHFVGMMAFDMGMPMNYNLWLTGLSMLFVVVGCAIGFSIVGIGTRGPLGIAAGGLVMGGSIGAMHYIGMLAMQMPAEVHWDRNIVILSLLIAVAASCAALWMAFYLEKGWQLIAAALVAGIAVCGMHYSGMFAWSYAMPEHHDVTLQTALSPAVVGGGLFLLSVIVLLIGIALIKVRPVAGELIGKAAPEARAGANA